MQEVLAILKSRGLLTAIVDSILQNCTENERATVSRKNLEAYLAKNYSCAACEPHHVLPMRLLEESFVWVASGTSD